MHVYVDTYIDYSVVHLIQICLGQVFAYFKPLLWSRYQLMQKRNSYKSKNLINQTHFVLPTDLNYETTLYMVDVTN